MGSIFLENNLRGVTGNCQNIASSRARGYGEIVDNRSVGDDGSSMVGREAEEVLCVVVIDGREDTIGM